MPTEPMSIWRDGVLVDTVQIEVSQDELNRRAIAEQAVTALTNNTAYLAIPAPTQAQAIAQVEALTRQNNKLIRLVLQRFDDTE